jgi:endonuclease YncB( thermonuclease family)
VAIRDLEGAEALLSPVLQVGVCVEAPMRKPAEFENHPVSYQSARGEGFLRAFCKNVTDGDTFDFFIDLGLNQYAYDTIRLYNLDTPEIFHPSTKAELDHGLAARARAKGLILDRPVLLRSYKDAETFGRYVAEVFFLVEGIPVSLATTLRSEGYEKRESYA